MDSGIRTIGGLIVVVLVACAVFFVAMPPKAQPEGPDNVIYFFYDENSTHCQNVMPFMANMTKKYPGANIRMLEIVHNGTNREIYASVHERLNRVSPGVPEVVVGKVILVGDANIPDQLELLIKKRLNQ